MTAFAEIVELQAATRPGELSHVFLDARGRETATLTWREFAARVRGVAAALDARDMVGKRVVLLCAWGEPFVVSLWGCLYAGAVPVPAPLDTFERSVGRASQIVAAAKPHLALVSTTTVDLASRVAPGVVQLDYEAAYRSEASTRPDRHWLANDEPALLQFTSGSTSHPRGVVLTVGNVLANCRAIGAAYDLTAADIGVSWLPMHHDMGLIGHALVPVFVGIRSVLMPSLGFLQRPERWLQAIGRYRGTVSAAPNFAFEYCLRRARPDSLEGLDLSCWRVAICGAEPVDATTLEGFATRFSQYGFQSAALRPSYGLAEATLLIAAGGSPEGPRRIDVDAERLEAGSISEALSGTDKVRTLISCGRVVSDTEVAIVDPVTMQACASSATGEIVLRGPGVSPGYLDASDERVVALSTATLRGTSGAGWYRTGDLGFRCGDELYVIGRRDDLMQIRGRNLHASEVEAVAGRAHESLEPSRCAAIGVPLEGSAALVVLAEAVRSAAPTTTIEQAIRKALSARLDIVPHEIRVLPVGSLPRTTSGKIRRRQCVADYRSGSTATSAVQSPVVLPATSEPSRDARS